MKAGEEPIDMGRLERPEADAFRYLAEALGARFAGDLPHLVPLRATRDGTRVEPGRMRVDRAGPAAPGVPPSDPRAAAVLDRVPVAILVVVGDGMAFVNRAAAGLFGYASSTILDAAGGLGALFDGQDKVQPGVLHMVAATGRRFAARVTMATIDWCGARAMLFTVVPSADVPDMRPPVAEHRSPAPRDPLVALLDANPDPIAIVTFAGQVEACNAAFLNLCGPRAAVRLDDRLEPEDLRHVFEAMQLSFLLSDGSARTTHPVRVGAASFAVTVGALKNGRLACLVFHGVAAGEPRATPRLIPAPPANDLEDVWPESATPLWRAVREVRRLVRDAAVLIVSEEEEDFAAPRTASEREAERQLLRLTLLAVAARATAGTVLTVRRCAADYTLTLSPARPDALLSAATSDRLLAMANAAGLALVLGTAGDLTLTPKPGEEDPREA